jgi:hypothetical protein
MRKLIVSSDDALVSFGDQRVPDLELLIHHSNLSRASPMDLPPMRERSRRIDAAHVVGASMAASSVNYSRWTIASGCAR